MDEKRLDSLLDEAVGAAPPEDVVRAVSPWRKAMVQVLWGLGLTAITFNFLGSYLHFCHRDIFVEEKYR